MKKRQIIYITTFLVVFGIWLPKSTYAQVITEIMYDLPSVDSGREWIEIYNNTNDTIAVTDFKLYEGTTGKNISTVEGRGGLLQKGEYAIIADNPEKFIEDNGTYEGLLFNSSFSLLNGGEELGLVNSQGDIFARMEYAKALGASGNGLSLQLFEDVFIEGVPTPGAENVKEVVSEEVQDGSENSPAIAISAHENQVKLSTASLERTVYVDIGRERVVREGETVAFQASAAGSGSARKITYIWNFGDGTTRKGRKVEHVYNHAGSYNVVVNAIMGTSRAVARTKVHVRDVVLKVAISESGLVISNEDSVEINIGSYYIKNKKDTYVFPKDTIIDSTSSITFDWEVLGFSLSEMKAELSKIYTSDKNKLPVLLE